MQFSFEETPESRSSTYEPPTFTLIYKAVGEQNDVLVAGYALAATPNTVFRSDATLYRKDLDIKPDGFAQYVVTVPYGRKEKKNTPVGNYTFDFDTTGATVNIKAAKEHLATYDEDGEVEEDCHKGAIGVKDDGEVEGVDIVIPALKLTYSFKHPLGIVTEEFARLLANATGHTNLNPFRGFAAGELLFIGATGGDGSEAEASVGYQFVASAATSALSIGRITDIVKDGHAVAWIEFADDTEEGNPVRKPKRVHIERVYDAIAFEDVFGWS